MSLLFCHFNKVPADKTVIPVHVLGNDEWELFAAALPPAQFNFAKARNFTAETGQRLRLPDADGHIVSVLFGAGRQAKDDVGAIRAGSLSAAMPAGYYKFERLPSGWAEDLAAIGWGIGAYKFDRYLSKDIVTPTLVIGDTLDLKYINSAVDATKLCRDLINTPASDMGPIALHEAVAKLAQTLSLIHI